MPKERSISILAFPILAHVWKKTGGRMSPVEPETLQPDFGTRTGWGIPDKWPEAP